MALRMLDKPRLCTRALALGLFAAAGIAGVGLTNTSAAIDASPASDQQVRDLQTKYEAERAQAEKSGANQKFSPDQLRQADLLAERGKTNVAAGRMAEAREAFRQARWYLPLPPPSLPDHVTRIFGSLTLRHSAPVVALAESPAGKRLASL